MFAVPLTDRAIYSKLGLYPKDPTHLSNIDSLRLTASEKFFDFLKELSTRTGGLAPRLKLIRAIANGFNYIINRSTVGSDVKADKKLFNMLKGYIKDDTDTGLDFYPGIDRDLHDIEIQSISLPNQWYTLTERFSFIQIDNPEFLNAIPDYISQIRPVLNVINIPFNDTTMYEHHIIKAYFRAPFTIHEFTLLSKKFKYGNYFILNESNLTEQKLRIKHNMPSDAFIVTKSTICLLFGNPNDNELITHLYLIDDYEKWQKLANKVTFEDVYEELFLKARSNNMDIMFLTLKSRLMSVKVEVNFHFDSTAMKKWTEMIQAMNENTTSLNTMSIVGSKGSGKSRLTKLILQHGIPGLLGNIEILDSDDFWLWLTVHIEDGPFELVESITKAEITKLREREDLVPICTVVMDRILMKYGGNSYIKARDSKSTGEARNFIRTFTATKEVLREFGEFYVQHRPIMTKFYTYYAGQIEDPENTTLLTFLHTNVETSFAPGTRFNWHLKTIFFPATAIIDRNRDPITEWMIWQYYVGLGDSDFTPIEPYMMLDSGTAHLKRVKSE